MCQGGRYTTRGPSLAEASPPPPVRRVPWSPQASRPAIAILENVLGIDRVLGAILTRLRQCGRYRVLVVEICPSKLGTDVRRPRYYFIMIRADVALDSQRALQTRVDEALARLEGRFARTRPAKWETLLFNEDHALVQAWRKDRNKKRMNRYTSGSGDRYQQTCNSKWGTHQQANFSTTQAEKENGDPSGPQHPYF